MEITEEEFEKRTNRKPLQDDLERANCKIAGTIGHLQCGWCTTHDKPRFMCGCVYKTASRRPEPGEEGAC